VDIAIRDYVIAHVGLCVYVHTYTYSFTDPSSAQDGMNVEFILKRAKLQHAVKSNQVTNYTKLTRT